MPRDTPLPSHLFDAHKWTDAAGELDELASIEGDELDSYVEDSAKNCRDNESGDVTADDLLELRDWLRAKVKP